MKWRNIEAVLQIFTNMKWMMFPPLTNNSFEISYIACNCIQIQLHGQTHDWWLDVPSINATEFKCSGVYVKWASTTFEMSSINRQTGGLSDGRTPVTFQHHIAQHRQTQCRPGIFVKNVARKLVGAWLLDYVMTLGLKTVRSCNQSVVRLFSKIRVQL